MRLDSQLLMGKRCDKVRGADRELSENKLVLFVEVMYTHIDWKLFC